MNPNKSIIAVSLVVFVMVIFVVFSTIKDKDDDPTSLEIHQLEDLIPEEDLKSVNISSDNRKAFAIVAKEKITEIHASEDTATTRFVIFDDLIFADLKTGEITSFDPFSELLSDEMRVFLGSLSSPLSHTLYVKALKWSDNLSEFWGVVNVVSSADPPIVSFASLFKINISDMSVESFRLPARFIAFLDEGNLNLNKNLILFETVTDGEGLSLVIYNFITEEEMVAVHYSDEVFSEHLPGNNRLIGYFYPDTASSDRRLRAEWLDDETYRYKDFVTREEITGKID